MDWTNGAKGPSYAVAAANTELVGRQLGMLLVDLIDKGMSPKNIHLIGFSLGAHVAGTASEVVKMKGHLIGRITGKLSLKLDLNAVNRWLRLQLWMLRVRSSGAAT